MQNYSSMKLELVALKWAVTEKFRDLLIGAEYEVYTENNPLSYLQTTAKLGATETRWAAALSQFRFKIRYTCRSGKGNMIQTRGLSLKLQTTVVLLIFWRQTRCRIMKMMMQLAYFQASARSNLETVTSRNSKYQPWPRNLLPPQELGTPLRRKSVTPSLS